MTAIEIEALKQRVAELEAAIRQHRDQLADDRCVEDDDKLYETLGDGVRCDRRVGSKLEMLTNCVRFIENRCEGGHWPSYRDLRDDLKWAVSLLDGTGSSSANDHLRAARILKEKHHLDDNR